MCAASIESKELPSCWATWRLYTLSSTKSIELESVLQEDCKMISIISMYCRGYCLVSSKVSSKLISKAKCLLYYRMDGCSEVNLLVSCNLESIKMDSVLSFNRLQWATIVITVFEQQMMMVSVAPVFNMNGKSMDGPGC